MTLLQKNKFRSVEWEEIIVINRRWVYTDLVSSRPTGHRINLEKLRSEKTQLRKSVTPPNNKQYNFWTQIQIIDDCTNFRIGKAETRVYSACVSSVLWFCVGVELSM
jgi:hypothetical protein